ncbi:hypothetical protein [Streptomyces qinglanensis]|uniref:hypothetical protein n=1 Tax=Streptomyces qinglanensis TaxID=943816 RepID=UPI003D721542
MTEPTTAALLASSCDACQHTLNWHRNDVGCTVPRCVCGRFQPTTPEAGSTCPQDGRTGAPGSPCLPDAPGGPQTGAQGRDCPDHGDPIECTCQARQGYADLRRERYAAAISATDGYSNVPDDWYRGFADAAMAMADAEQAELRDQRDRAIRVAVALENQLAALVDYAQHSDDNVIHTRETILRLTKEPTR